MKPTTPPPPSLPPVLTGEAAPLVAAVDMGSNSFHLVVARYEHGQLRIVDRLRDSVALAAGLDGQKHLNAEARQRALACIARFGQRLREMHPGSVRAVGTSALRQAKNAREFLDEAAQVLGHPIEVVSGHEEARLIYLGVAHTMAERASSATGSRLVVDIGGGSTELIIGEGFEPLRMDSLSMGCVSFTQRFFADGRLDDGRFERASMVARQELQSIVELYRKMGWSQAIGSSGTILTADALLREQGNGDEALTARGLRRLIKQLVGFGQIGRIDLPGLKADRAAQLPGGLVILEAVLSELGVDRMGVSQGAMREGLLYDLMGRIQHEDIREATVRALMQRHHVDEAHAARVEVTARHLAGQVGTAWGLSDERAQLFLSWGARLHEIGLSMAYSGYHKHGAYLLTHADMPGFSNDDQRLLASIVLGHRRKLVRETFAAVDPGDVALAQRLCMLVRLSARLNRGRMATALPELRAVAARDRLQIEFPAGWLAEHPLTLADLEEEVDALRGLGVQLKCG